MKTLFRRIIWGVIVMMAVALMPTKEAEATNKTTSDYLTFIALEDNSSITFNFETGTAYFRKNTTTDYAEYNGETIWLNENDWVEFYGENVTTGPNKHFSMNGKIDCSGSVTSLTDKNGDKEDVNLSVGCYQYMFRGCSSLVSSPRLPATKLADYCYYGMFENCSSLTEAPALPATKLADYCYYGMFQYCRSLTEAPALPATTLADCCYEYMFFDCKSLTKAPALPATTLKKGCYYGMFQYCRSLTEAPALPATTLADYCYGYMFTDCKSLAKAPALPATTLEKGCYYAMFANCSSLTEAPALPATTLAKECYKGMFTYCSSLTEAPALPATTLTDYCYSGMFWACTSVTEAPVLPATKLAENCYSKMFYDCSKLLVANSIDASLNITDTFVLPVTDKNDCYVDMFYAAGTETDKLMPSTPEPNVTYYCKFRKSNIIYELNGGINNSDNPSIYAVGIGVSKLSSPAKDGYTFDGWYEDSAFSKKIESISNISVGDITLYAKWKPNVYKLTFETNEGINSNDNPSEYTYGEGVAKLAEPAREGYTFDGWYADAGFTNKVATISTDNKGDITLYAKWTKNPYQETVNTKKATYELSLDSNDRVTGAKLITYTDKKATTVTVSTVEYNGQKINVTEIGDKAFANNKKLKNITISNYVTTIGKSAFSGCTALKTVKLGTKVKTIGDKAFYKCKALTKVTLNTKVTSIGSKAFQGCAALKNITIKTTKLTSKTVGKNAFSGINSKATVKVPKKNLSAYTKLLKKVGISKKTQKIKK